MHFKYRLLLISLSLFLLPGLCGQLHLVTAGSVYAETLSPVKPVPPPPPAFPAPPVFPPGVPATVSPELLPAAETLPDALARPALPRDLLPKKLPSPVPRPPLPVPVDTPVDDTPLLTEATRLLAPSPTVEPLLPGPDPDPGVVYVVPFIFVMVPPEVQEMVFDRFVDLLNQHSDELKLKFIILKQGIEGVDHNWLDARKYVLGDVYAYVEESGCCSTDIRTRLRLRYYRAGQEKPVFDFHLPQRIFFDHDQATLPVKREELGRQIADRLVSELYKTLKQGDP